MSSKLNLLLENRFLGHKQAVYDLQLDGFGGWYSAGSEGWIVHWQGGSESNGKLIAQTGEPIYSIYVMGRQSEYILAGGQSGMVYAFRRIGPTVPKERENTTGFELNSIHGNNSLTNPGDDNFEVLKNSESELNSIHTDESQMRSENWDFEDLKFEKMWEYRIHEKGVFDFHAISIDQYSDLKSQEKMIISCAADGVVALWDLENPMNNLVKSNSIGGSLRCIDAASRLDTQLRVGGNSGKVYEFKIEGSSWESFEFQEIHEFCIGNNTLFQMVHHQRLYAFGGRDAKIWLTDDRLHIHKKMDAHWFSIHALAFSPDGNYLASGSMDKSIRLWDTESGELLVHKELAHRSSVNQFIWLDRETLISCSDDTQIISWKIKH